MKIFITGGSGLIGQYLNIELSQENEILTQYYSHTGNCKNFNSVKVDICDYNAIEKIFESFQPNIVIHTAAVSNTDKADLMETKKVFEINVNSTQRIAELCDKYNAKLIYLSTDLVYAGYRGSMLKEDAKLIPISLYAETKLMGEIKIQHTFNNYIILREALIYGFGLNHSRNHFHTMYEKLSNSNPIVLFTDQFRTPLSVKESARMIGELIKKDISSEVINFAGKERVSRYELGEILCDKCKLNTNLLIKSTMEEAGIPYKVADVSLSIDKLKSLGIQPKSIDESLEEMFANV